MAWFSVRLTASKFNKATDPSNVNTNKLGGLKSMNYFDIPLVVLFAAAIYLCVIYLGLGWIQRSGLPRRKDKPLPLDSSETIRPS